MRLSGSNFQRWPNFDIEIDGLTVIVGPKDRSSNKGKSALFRALRGILRNDLAAEYVRNGQKEPLELTLKLPGHVIKASRSREGSSEYVIDGKPFSKLNRKVPKEIIDLGFNPVVIGTEQIDPIFATQNESQFLLDKRAYSSALLNSILGAFGGTDKLEIGKKEANARTAKKNSEAHTLAVEINEINQRVDILEKLSDSAVVIGDRMYLLESSARSLEDLYHCLIQTHVENIRLSKLREVAAALVIPDYSSSVSKKETLDILRTAILTGKSLQYLKEQENLFGQVVSRWSKIRELYLEITILREVLPIVKAGEDLEVKQYPQILGSLIETLEKLYSEVTKAQSSISCIELACNSRERIAELEKERVSLDEEQEAVTRVKCPKCGMEF